MKLHVLERINLTGILPAQGNLVSFRILADLKKALAFTEKELKEFGIKQVGDQITWTKSKEVEIPIGEQATIIIQTALKQVDAEGKVTEHNYSLFGKFPFDEEEKK